MKTETQNQVPEPAKMFPVIIGQNNQGEACYLSDQFLETGIQPEVCVISKSEHAALVAVSELAEAAYRILDALDLRPGHQCTTTMLGEALAAVRAGKDGAK